MLTLALFPLSLVVDRSPLVGGPRYGQVPTTLIEEPLDMRR